MRVISSIQSVPRPYSEGSKRGGRCRIARGEIVPVVEVADELLRVHQIEVAGEFRDAEFSLGRDRRLRGDALPRGDDNHAVGARASP